ncbi:DUF6496 domain-containing protein [Pseudobacter ginsenosidimutans]|uniref:Histone H1-like protein n=1 Tax=Pseudobacter ginsenosidimutans TaxID=661488 RepID=A0A4Q7N2X4_9BACT|nr:DUF6496 domain-containing protein [Pseudobacter ginsenosidimutans]QEC43045.1 histone H1-like protein [Pseudobacter ginsenosidimutans]RZS74398.1 hypothetical protein EV199_0245 [Pseudobacter ginsenosidimutans]
MPRYSKGASKSVESAMRRKKKGTLRSGPGGKGGKVKSREQAIAIGLSEAREKGAKVPKKKSAGKTATKKSASKKSASKKSAPKKAASRKTATRKSAVRKSATRKKAAPRKKAATRKKSSM